ncbi:MAG: polysaccharide deacetylase family protein [Bacteroidetes bacterium]|nr:polysaccharide deacetylase family protein [Bacteroidota bacterium]
MRTLLTILFFVSRFVSIGQQKQVCISIDDLPVVNYGITDSAYQINVFNKILYSLKKNEVPAIGFVNEVKLFNDSNVIHYQVDLLKSWVSNGLELGNHSFSHKDYNNVPFHLYTNEIIKGETVTKKLLSDQNRQIKYFRHPYLHIGNTKVKADSLNDFLNKHNYVTAPVTIDNEDYVFASAYSRAKQKDDTTLMNKIGLEYIAYMGKKIKYYEKQSNHLFGRNISQILLIHASLLNSDYLNSLIALFKANNYVFVSMDNALKDPAYKTEITVFGNWGISWIERWALSTKRKEYINEDPVTPDYIRELGN